jgi:hypothetical protein
MRVSDFWHDPTLKSANVLKKQHGITRLFNVITQKILFHKIQNLIYLSGLFLLWKIEVKVRS